MGVAAQIERAVNAKPGAVAANALLLLFGVISPGLRNTVMLPSLCPQPSAREACAPSTNWLTSENCVEIVLPPNAMLVLVVL